MGFWLLMVIMILNSHCVFSMEGRSPVSLQDLCIQRIAARPDFFTTFQERTRMGLYPANTAPKFAAHVLDTMQWYFLDKKEKNMCIIRDISDWHRCLSPIYVSAVKQRLSKVLLYALRVMIGANKAADVLQLIDIAKTVPSFSLNQQIRYMHGYYSVSGTLLDFILHEIAERTFEDNANIVDTLRAYGAKTVKEIEEPRD